MGRDQNFYWFGFFGDSSRLLRESVDEGAASFIDPEFDSSGWRAHDVQQFCDVLWNSKVR